MNVDLRPARQEDIDTIRMICSEASQTEGSDWDSTYPDNAIISDGIAKGDLFVITLDGESVGIVAAGQNGTLESIPPEFAEDGAAEIARFGLCDMARGKGVAKKILAILCDRFKKQGYAKVRLMVFCGFERGIRLYEKSGFVRIGVIRAYDLEFFCYEKLL